MMLGRIQQSVDDLRALLLKNENQQDAHDSRIASLERTRIWTKAWLTGAGATAAGAFWFAWHVYTVVRGIAR